VTYGLTQEGEDKLIYEFADGGASLEGDAISDAGAANQLVLEFYAQLTGTRSLAYDPAPKELTLAQDYLATYGPECSTFIVHHALEAARAVDFPIQKFGGTKNFLPQALVAWGKRAETEEAKREAEARVDGQLRREQAERDRRRRLVELRAALPADTLEALRRRAEEVIANDGTDGTHLGYDVLVKMKMDELIEREVVPTDTSDDGGHAEIAAT
jgi:hypothetical protein